MSMPRARLDTQHLSIFLCFNFHAKDEIMHVVHLNTESALLPIESIHSAHNVYISSGTRLEKLIKLIRGFVIN